MEKESLKVVPSIHYIVTSKKGYLFFSYLRGFNFTIFIPSPIFRVNTRALSSKSATPKMPHDPGLSADPGIRLRWTSFRGRLTLKSFRAISSSLKASNIISSASAESAGSKYIFTNYLDFTSRISRMNSLAPEMSALHACLGLLPEKGEEIIKPP